MSGYPGISPDNYMSWGSHRHSREFRGSPGPHSKVKVKWDHEAEKKMIDIWADLLEKHLRKMISRKNKDKIATARLNKYLAEDLGMT